MAFAGSYMLAHYLKDNGVKMPVGVINAMHWVESVFTQEPVIMRPPVISNQPTALNESERLYQHTSVGRTKACKDTSMGEVEYKKEDEVYTWVDERGIANFSNTPPKKGGFKLLNYAGEKVFDYFILDLNTESLPYDFHQ